jgi:hypothetical protein
MGFMIRQIGPAAALRDEHVLEAVGRTVPQAAVRAAIAETGAAGARCRKLPAELTVLLVVALGLFPHESQQRVLAKLLAGLRLIWPGPGFRAASKGAICQARYRLGARPAAALFHRVCLPLAAPGTPGAFLFGLRLMAMDGTAEDLPDSPENARAFGRPGNQHGPAAFPQLLAMYLVECGTHAIVDAGFWPCRTSEHVGGRRLLRSVAAGMLVLWDRGLHSFALAEGVRAREAHFLGRVPAGVRLPVAGRLADGSYLAWLHPAEDDRRCGERRLRVRVVEYTLADPGRPGAGERHRLMTSLLDPAAAPALDLICAYHERWEVELTIDEVDTHQRLLQHPLRSRKPVGVAQELYGLLIAHYAVRAVMYEAAAQAALDPRRLSFANAVQLVGAAIPEFQQVRPEQRPALYQRLLEDIRHHPLPPRRNRTYPRVTKRTRAKHPPKHPHHHHWPQPTLTFRQAIALLI